MVAAPLGRFRWRLWAPPVARLGMSGLCPGRFFVAAVRESGVPRGTWALGASAGGVRIRARWGVGSTAEPGLRVEVQRKSNGSVWTPVPLSMRQDGYGRYRWRTGSGVQCVVRSGRLLDFLKHGRLAPEEQADHRSEDGAGRHKRYGGRLVRITATEHGKRHGAAGGRASGAKRREAAAAKRKAAAVAKRKAAAAAAAAKREAAKTAAAKAVALRTIAKKKAPPRKAHLPGPCLPAAPIRRASAAPPKAKPKAKPFRPKVERFRRCPIKGEWFPVSGPGRCRCCRGRR